MAVTEIGEKGWENAAVRGPSGSLGVLWVVFDEVHVARRGAHHGHTVKFEYSSEEHLDCIRNTPHRTYG